MCGALLDGASRPPPHSGSDLAALALRRRCALLAAMRLARRTTPNDRAMTIRRPRAGCRRATIICRMAKAPVPGQGCSSCDSGRRGTRTRLPSRRPVPPCTYPADAPQSGTTPTSMKSSRDAEIAVDVAIQLVAMQVGGWERTLARHEPLPSGLCGGCSSRPARWPCSAASIARKARERQPYRPDREAADVWRAG
jgi:hypothetical protein